MLDIDFVSKVPQKKRQLIIDAIITATSTLMPRVKRTISIYIEVHHGLLSCGVAGDIFQEDNDEFTIRLDSSLDNQELVATILHEMVHLWQYASKRMSQINIGVVRFDKQVYDLKLPYDQRPWEIEAYIIEQTLMDKWNGYQR